MFGLQTSDDYQPVGWIGRYPVHATTLLVLVHVATMIAAAVASAAGYGLWIEGTFGYSSAAVFQHFAFWQFATYPFVHAPTIWFAVEMYLLFSFGREVERFIGRRAFLSLYALLVLVPPCILTALGLFIPSALEGSGILNFCVFLAFATIYPNVRLMFGLVVKWVALVLLGLYTLQTLAGTDWTGLLVLWASAALAFAGIRRLRGQPIFEGFGMSEFGRDDAPMATRYEKPARRAAPKTRKSDETSQAEVDAILDKISTHGLASLSSRERTKLERASRYLGAKDRRP